MRKIALIFSLVISSALSLDAYLLSMDADENLQQKIYYPCTKETDPACTPMVVRNNFPSGFDELKATMSYAHSGAHQDRRKRKAIHES